MASLKKFLGITQKKSIARTKRLVKGVQELRKIKSGTKSFSGPSTAALKASARTGVGFGAFRSKPRKK